ncbi:MAG: TIGR00303 family protein [archaeon YNP-LCB-003-016]|uniref:nicotinate mononucleotide-dependent phosphoribosyltransferase CobT n=1 Tax=Candidatus Culexarchaeum yellowstonense TaxID=2928963 RepID=UPI0026F27530|nr:TIGR00303 family protein [Candidatus Culexarchaeum yellowstonense]MCR6691711.1 TIGR00303 family protein [Candidatus Culexarchaeum yellowstonense]
MKKIYDIILAYEESKCEDFIKRIEGKKPLFIHVIGTTETAKIPGISAAGKYPELTDYTPAADAELLLLGSCKCIPGVPTTPEGIPTPALITMSALRLADVPTLIVSGGVKIRPHIPFIDLGGKSGGDIRSGKAVADAEEILVRARIAGENLSKLADYLVIGESVPGGTTTALAVMLAMGVDARGKVSSSMPYNPHELKIRVVEEGLRNSGIKFGSLSNDPITAISCVGDPMMPAFAGLVLGAARRSPVLMAGGTQMCAILAIVKALDQTILQNIAIGTTRWLISDRSADLKGIVSQIADVPIMAADLDFARSKFNGLRVYEEGFVKEGVGAGGASIAAMAKSRGLISKAVLLEEIERNYERLVMLRRS